MKTYTSKEILRLEDLYELQDTFSCCFSPFKYQLTEGEYEWAKFTQFNYSTPEWVLKNIDDNLILTFNCPEDMSECLEGDGIGCKAPMLSDETALQKLFFWLNIND